MKPEYVGEWDDNVLLVSCPCCEADRAYQIPSPAEEAVGIIEACQSCGYIRAMPKTREMSPAAMDVILGRREVPCKRSRAMSTIPFFFFRACPVCNRPDSVRIVKGQKPYCTYCREYSPQRPAKSYSQVTEPVAWKRNRRREMKSGDIHL